MPETIMRMLALFAGSLLACCSALAQNFPTRPVHLIVAQSTGSPPDVLARGLADGLAKLWGQQVIVENKPGASGIVAVSELMKGKPDGHYMLLGDVGTLAINASLFRKLPYDPQKDLVPVVDVLTVPWVFFTSKRGRFKTIGELIAAAKAEPGKYTYASAGLGSPTSMVAELLKLRAGINLLEVPFKETSQLQPAVVNNEVDVYITSMGGARALRDKLNALGMAARQRDPLHPDVPTVEEAGGPAGFEVLAWSALTVVRDVPQPVVQKIREDTTKVMQDADLRKRAAQMGMSLGVGKSTDELQKFINGETERYREAVKASKATVE